MNMTSSQDDGEEDVLFDIREREFDFFINFAMPYMFLALGNSSSIGFFVSHK